MRYDLKKYLFVGAESDRIRFFRQAQEAGIIQFIDAQGRKPSMQQFPELQHLTKAIKILREQPVVEQEESEDWVKADQLAEQIINFHESLLMMQEEKRTTQLEMARVEVFGDFSPEEVHRIEQEGRRKIQFFFAKHGRIEESEQPPELIYVGSDHDLDYFVSISSESKQYPKMVEMEIPRPIGTLKHNYQSLLKRIDHAEESLKKLAKYNAFLHHALIHKLNQVNLEQTRDFVEFPLTDSALFAVQGWVPDNKIDELNTLVAKRNVVAEEIGQNPEDIAPTYLENHGASKIGEDILHIYDTPSNTDRDPSLWVLVFFSLFFAMIINDGGYGLIFLLTALYIRFKHGKLESWRGRLLSLVTILAFAVVVWGLLTTSFFGIPVSPDNPLRKFSVLSWLVEKNAEWHMVHKDETYHEWTAKYPELAGIQAPSEFLMKATTKDADGTVNYIAFNKFSDSIMMELALLIGVLHILLSMGRYLDRNPQNLGWMIFLVGAYLYIPKFLGSASIVNYLFGVDRDVAAHNGLYLLYGGFALAVIIAIFKHKLLGLLEATVVIQLLADVLSYLRIYALGLAGSLMTATILEMAAGVPFILGVVIFLFGHSVNILLSIMGGVIHGLRLNFLEWYHYSFEGGGKMFNPLRKQEID